MFWKQRECSIQGLAKITLDGNPAFTAIGFNAFAPIMPMLAWIALPSADFATTGPRTSGIVFRLIKWYLYRVEWPVLLLQG
jgi:hypothetical protein